MAGSYIYKTYGIKALLIVSVLFATGCGSEALLKGDRTQQLYRHPRFHTVQSGDSIQLPGHMGMIIEWLPGGTR
jgi:hypothetical protein